MLRASDAYFASQELEHGRPSLQQNLGGRHGQAFSLPRVVTNAIRGLVVEVDFDELVDELVVVKDACHDAAYAHGRHAVGLLQAARY
jgi:hypothetical protein